MAHHIVAAPATPWSALALARRRRGPPGRWSDRSWHHIDTTVTTGPTGVELARSADSGPVALSIGASLSCRWHGDAPHRVAERRAIRRWRQREVQQRSTAKRITSSSSSVRWPWPPSSSRASSSPTALSPGGSIGGSRTSIPGSHASFYVVVTWFRYPWVVVAGAVVIAGLTVTRDRMRALAYLVGPPLAVLIAEELVKPLVGRTLGGALDLPVGVDHRCRRVGHGGDPRHLGPLAMVHGGGGVRLRVVDDTGGGGSSVALPDRRTGRHPARCGRGADLR